MTIQSWINKFLIKNSGLSPRISCRVEVFLISCVSNFLFLFYITATVGLAIIALLMSASHSCFNVPYDDKNETLCLVDIGYLLLQLFARSKY